MTRRRLIAALLVIVAVLAFAVASRSTDDPDARLAHAEYLVACNARDRAAAAAREATELGGEQAAADAEKLAREAGDYAEQLRRECGERWGRLGLR